MPLDLEGQTGKEAQQTHTELERTLRPCTCYHVLPAVSAALHAGPPRAAEAPVEFLNADIWSTTFY